MVLKSENVSALSTEPHKNIMWISAFPEPCSLNGSLRLRGISHLRASGNAVVESDLYRMNWMPVLSREGLAQPDQRFDATADARRAFLERQQPEDVRIEQEKICEADAIIFQFPLWWYSVPAILKGWFDRVFVSGFAFGKDPATGDRLRFEQGPFLGKRALVVLTLGDRPASIGPRGKSGELLELLFGLLHGTLAYTGMSVLPPFSIPSADFVDESTYSEHASRLIRRLDGLFTDPALPYRPQFQGDYTDEWALTPSIRPRETGLSVHLISDEE